LSVFETESVGIRATPGSAEPRLIGGYGRGALAFFYVGAGAEEALGNQAQKNRSGDPSRAVKDV
jgi:hypothetical protein